MSGQMPHVYTAIRPHSPDGLPMHWRVRPGQSFFPNTPADVLVLISEDNGTFVAGTVEELYEFARSMIEAIATHGLTPPN